MAKRILIVDDDMAVVQALSVRLTAHHYTVIAVYDALYAVQKAFEEKPDLILLDIKMPAGGGFSVFERVRLLGRTSTIPVVFLTASDDENLKKKALEMGAKGFIKKPFDGEQVAATIKEIIGE